TATGPRAERSCGWASGEVAGPRRARPGWRTTARPIERQIHVTLAPAGPSTTSGPRRVRATRAATDSEWDRIVDASPHATFFHTREWAQVWEGYTGGALRPSGE